MLLRTHPLTGTNTARLATRVTSGLFALTCVACQGDPSFTLRWELDRATDEASPIPIITAQQCSATGVAYVRTRVVSQTSGDVVGTKTFPCFTSPMEDPTRLLAGPSLDVSGPHVIELWALDRARKEWAIQAQSDPNIPEGVGFTFLEVNLDGENTVEISAPIAITAPPECVDGVDNDIDGLVDRFDSACLLDPTGTEDGDQLASQLLVEATFFQANPDFRCAIVGVDAVSLEVVDALGTTIFETSESCDVRSVDFGILTLVLDPGTYEVRTVAVDSQGLPMTSINTAALEVTTDEGIAAEVLVDFPASSFSPAIELPMSTRFIFEDTLHQCTPSVNVGGELVLDELELLVVDENGVPVPAADFDAEGTTTPEGGLIVPCTTNAIDGPTAIWGQYFVSAAVRSGGVDCFAADAVPLAPRLPGDTQSIILDRVFVDGAVPPECVECEVDQDCNIERRCDQNLCVLE